MRSSWEVRIGTFRLAGLIAILLAGQALGASSVVFTLEVGGDNHSAEYKAGNPQLFTPGNPANSQTVPRGITLTWDAKAEASGIQAAGNGAGLAIYGLANYVFNLELHQGSAGGPLVTSAIFQSTINDGNNGDLLRAAAFAMSFNIGGQGPGRCVDVVTGGTGLKGGPYMGGVDTSTDRVRSATYPAASPGVLLGMGAGYSPPPSATKSWVAASMKPGVGMVTLPNLQPGLGIVPLCEGQIDTSNLTVGTTYVLVLVPRPGTNVLRGDVNYSTDLDAFATAADSTTGDDISFIVGPELPCDPASNPDPPNGATEVQLYPTLTWSSTACAVSHDVYFGSSNPPPFIQNQAGTSYAPDPLANGQTYYWRIDERNASDVVTTGTVWHFQAVPVLTATAWRSMRTHTGAGELSINLDPAKVGNGASGPNSECRSGGIRKIQVDFTKNVALNNPPPISGSDGSHPVPDTAVILPNLRTLEMTFPAGRLVDRVTYTIDLANEIYSEDYTEIIQGDTDCKVRSLVGDANQNGGVTLADALLVKAKIGQPAASWVVCDMNLSGGITLADALLAKAQIGHSAP